MTLLYHSGNLMFFEHTAIIQALREEEESVSDWRHQQLRHTPHFCWFVRQSLYVAPVVLELTLYKQAGLQIGLPVSPEYWD